MNLILTLILALGAVGTPAEAIKGLATWYDAPSRTDAAAGPALRKALGPDWRGQWVTVKANGRSVKAHLTDFCACSDRHGKPTLIDLDDEAFAALAPLGTGVLAVTIETLGRVPHLPATDVAEERVIDGRWAIVAAILSGLFGGLGAYLVLTRRREP